MAFMINSQIVGKNYLHFAVLKMIIITTWNGERSGSRISQKGHQPQKLEAPTYHSPKFSRNEENWPKLGRGRGRASKI